jgi:hypothetical protein
MAMAAVGYTVATAAAAAEASAVGVGGCTYTDMLVMSIWSETNTNTTRTDLNVQGSE